MARIISFGEVLLRLASPGQGLLLQEPLLVANFCGAEVNAATALAGFGHDCAVVTALPDSEIGDAAMSDLRKFNLDMEFVSRSANRMGQYFLGVGAMNRPSRIIYDRANSAFAAITGSTYDWDTILDGASWLYISGITAALGDGPLAELRKAVDTARRKRVKIAFDSNYRPTLWKGREKLGAEILTELALKADLLFAGRRAIGMMVGGTFDQPDPNAAFAEAARAFFDFSPRASYVAATRRDVKTSDCQDLTSLLAARDEVVATRTVTLDRIVDRIGTGDAFGAAILHGLIERMPLMDCANFARAASQWAHSVPGDYLRASVADIEGLLDDNAGDVRR